MVGLVFEKPSLRTRVSFEAGVAQLGGTSLFLPGNEVGLGWRETRRRLRPDHVSQYVDALVLRVFKHATVDGRRRALDGARSINGLSDTSHPCQALADLLTMQEAFGDVEGQDGRVRRRRQQRRPVAGGRLRQARGAVRPGVARTATASTTEFLTNYRKHVGPKLPDEIADPAAAVKDADVIYTDVWTSMGQEAERDERLQASSPRSR